MLIGENHHGVRLASPEHQDAQDAKAFACVRPHDLDASAGGSGDIVESQIPA